MEQLIREAGFRNEIQPWDNEKPNQRLGWKGKGTPRARDSDTAKKGWAWWPKPNPDQPFAQVSVPGEWYALVPRMLLQRMLRELTEDEIQRWFRLGTRDKTKPRTQWMQDADIRRAPDLGVTIEEIREFLRRISGED
jgi:hypothetical protein